MWTESGEQFGPAELASLENAKGIGKGKTEAVAKNAGTSGSIVEKLGHWVIGMACKTWRSSRRRADAGEYQRHGKSGRACRSVDKFDGGYKRRERRQAKRHSIWLGKRAAKRHSTWLVRRAAKRHSTLLVRRAARQHSIWLE
mgnify:CR=1 FL=1